MIKKLFIEGLSCSHCVNRVDKALKAIPEVITVEVNLKGNYALVDVRSDIENKILIDAISEAGYDVIKID